MLRRRVRIAGARFFHFHYQYTEKMVLVTSNEYWLPPVFNHSAELMWRPCQLQIRCPAS